MCSNVRDSVRVDIIEQALATVYVFGYAGILVGLTVNLALMLACDLVRCRRSLVLKSTVFHGSSYCSARDTPADC